MTKRSTSDSVFQSSRPRLDASSMDSMTATLTSDGKAAIPSAIRDALAMQAGDQMTFALLPGGTILIRVKNQTIMNAAGCLYDKSRAPLPAEALSR